MNRRKNLAENIRTIECPEKSPWDTGFSVFKRRINEQLQLNGVCDYTADDDDLLPFYRNGESETFILSSFGCTVGV